MATGIASVTPMPHASFPSSQASKSPTNDGRRRHAEDGEVDIARTHTTSPWRWDEHPGIEFWNIDLTLNYTDHNAPGNPKPALIARASLVRIDCSRCMEISFELDQFSFDLGRIGGAIGDSRDKLEPHQIYSATNSTILIAEDVLVDKFWRGRQLGPSLVVFAAELLRSDGTFLMPLRLGKGVGDQYRPEDIYTERTIKIYGEMMTKTLIDLDDAALNDAKRALRTRTKKDTVNESLAVVVALSARRRDLERFAADAHADLRDADIMSSAWQR